jgi:hypothetical protein
MIQKLTSSLIVLLLLVNIFFEITVSHHVDLFDGTSATSQSTIQPYNAIDDVQPTQHADTCANGTCHSGYCKLLNLNPLNYNYNVLNHIVYNLAVLNMPDSPYLMGNRRPPKHA